MNSIVTKVAIIGGGISGAVCASTPARNGVSVTFFESARGPGGLMSQRRVSTDEIETLDEIRSFVRDAESNGLSTIAEFPLLTKNAVESL